MAIPIESPKSADGRHERALLSGITPHVERRKSSSERLHRCIYYLAVLLFLVPLLLSTHPPMVDLPQHASQIAMLAEFETSPHHYNEHFVLNWKTPYLVGYLSTWALLKIMPLVWALKLVVAGSLVAFAWVGDALNRRLGGRAMWSYCLLPGLYSCVFYWGFLNFLVGAPFLVAFVWLVQRYTEKPSLKLAICTAIASLCLLPFHILLAAFGGVVGLGMVFFSSPHFRAFALRGLPLFAGLPPALAWLAWVREAESQTRGATQLGYSWQRFLDAITFIVPFKINWMGVAVGTLVLALPLLAGGRLHRNPGRWWPLAMASLALLFFPQFIFGTGLIAERFALFLPVFLLFALRPSEALISKPLQWAFSLCVLALSLGLHFSYFQSFEERSADARTIYRTIPPGRKIASLAFDAYIDGRPFPVLAHYAQWYVAEKGGFVDFSFASYFPQLVRYPQEHKITFPRGLDAQPARFNYHRHKGREYDYFLVHSTVSPRDFLFAGVHEKWESVARGRGWWLYKQVRP